MTKRFLSIVLVLALSVTMFVFEANAEGTITLELLDGKVGSETYSSNYSPYTLPGTKLNAKSVASLSSGQEVVYFLNGVEVGRNSAAGNFNFTSVEGANRMQAKIMEGDTVIATSDIIEKVFTPIVKNGNDLYTYDISSADSNKTYYTNMGTSFTYVEDPIGAGRNVAKVSLPAGATSATCNTDVPRSDFYPSQTGITASGIIRADYKIYIENSATNIILGGMVFGCGCNHTGNAVQTDWPSTRMKSGTRSGPLTKGEWLDISIVIDNNRKVYDISIGGVQAVTEKPICTNASHADDDKYLKRIQLAKTASRKVTTTNENGETVESYVMSTYYLKDASIYKCVEPGISISHVCGNGKAVAGSKVVINATSSYENVNIVYYCNGVKYTDNKVKASAGTNTVYAEAIGASGNVLGTSEPITFEAYADTFVNSYSEAASAFEASTVKQNKKTGRGPFASVASLSRLYYASADVKVESIAQGTTFGVAPTFHIKNKNGNTAFGSTEVWPGFFTFESDGIKVANGVSGTIGVTSTIKVPYTSGKDTYNIKMICDPLYGSYILLVDDVVYSVIDVSATRGSATYDLTPNLADYKTYGFLYLDSTLNPSNDETNPNKVTLTYKAGYSTLPANHSSFEYINNAKLVTSRSEISATDDLKVKFVATKGDVNSVLCIATVLETGGELICLATEDVTFDETKDSEEVELTLTNLPSGIANGNYTVNVMLWDADTQEPIVTKTVLK